MTVLPPAAGPAAEPIAIIGMACLFPQAPDLATFWNNIIGAVDTIGEPLPEWDAQRYLDAGRIKTPFGGYLKDLYRFDPREFGIMPNSIDGGEPDQFLALRIARDALLDAGYLGKQHDHRDTGIVLGHSTYLHRGQVNAVQGHMAVDEAIDLLQAAVPTLDDAALSSIRAMLQGKLRQVTPDIAPGLVPNVMTGRIANRLDLRGPNYLIDAACSSSLLAVGAAIDELRAGRSRMMLAGGVNASMPGDVLTVFTLLGALSGRGKVRPFEAGSDGTLLGEGLGVVVLKRLSDAQADGDRIYAVVRGVGQASDGRGTGLLAPSVEGETLALQRAYGNCGVDPASISLIEAHGTGIPLGDQTEIAALKNLLGARQGVQGSVALGSVKSMISHCIPAAGIAGLIKTALAIRHRVLPPTLCDTVNPALGIESTPMYINTAAAPWIAPLAQPRRAGVNSFGFGGINAHAVVEEPPASALRPKTVNRWPAELCVLSAPTLDALVASLEALAAGLQRNPGWGLAEVAAALAAQDAQGDFRFALVAKDTAALAKGITAALPKLRENKAPQWSTRAGAQYGSTRLDGQIAFLFPGEGSQYLGMLGDLAMCFDEVRHWLDFWHGLYPDGPGATRTDIVFPPAVELTPARRETLERRLHEMDVGSEAVMVGGQAMFALLTSLGVQPDVMVGHSSGESAALAAAASLGSDDPQQLADAIRRLNAIYRGVLDDGKIPRGALLAVGALPAEQVRALLAADGGEVLVAMDNCANQLVLYGSTAAVERVQVALVAAGAICLPLPFDRGYHTPAFDLVSTAFLEFYRNIALGLPRVPLYSCASADRFPGDVAAMRELAAAQWSRPVRFRETIERMHADGVRCFIEVGPSGNLTAFVGDILAGREHLAAASNLRRRNGVEQLLSLLAQLYASGRQVDLARLFAPRAIAAIDLGASVPARGNGLLIDNTMPMLRLDDADKALVQRLVAAAQPQPPTPAQAETAPHEPAPSGPETDAQAAGPHAQQPVQAQVMGDYFDVMRGFLQQQHAVLEGWQARGEPALETPDPAPPGAPFIDEIVESDVQHLVARCRLSVHRERFLRDHVLSGRVSATDPELLGLACVPLMVSLEIMAEASALLAGSAAVCSIENVRAFDWIALDDGEVQLEVRARWADAAGSLVHAALFNGGKPVVNAEFRFQPAWQCEGVAPLAAMRPSRWQGQDGYTAGMFHGPVFQSIEQIEGFDDGGIDTRLSDVSLVGFLDDGQTPSLVLNPVLLDAVGQLAAAWVAQYAGTDFNAFPSTIERIELYRPGAARMPGLTLKGRQHALDAAHAGEVGTPRAWQFECVDAAGEPVLRVRNLVNVYFDVPHRFYQVRRDPLNAWLGQPEQALQRPGAMLWTMENLSEEFCSQSAAIFLRILAHCTLGFDELDAWRALGGSAAHRRQWLLGRICLKEAVRHWVHAATGEMLYPSDVVVLHDAQGKPFVDGWWRDTLLPAPEVSLAHDARACLAAVSAPQRAVGVDIEELGRVQRPELLLASFTAQEQAAVQALPLAAQPEALLRVWCAKEAAAKFLGTGLQGRPEAFDVRFADVAGQVAEQAAEQPAEQAATVWCGDMAIDVAVQRVGHSIVALADGWHSSMKVH